MSLPNINFENIRPVDGNRHQWFEEMCCQLASLEPASLGEYLYRKGYGDSAESRPFTATRVYRHPIQNGGLNEGNSIGIEYLNNGDYIPH